ncbi:MAG: hypothetical protein U0667_17390 [Chloroflexota bacterium]
MLATMATRLQEHAQQPAPAAMPEDAQRAEQLQDARHDQPSAHDRRGRGQEVDDGVIDALESELVGEAADGQEGRTGHHRDDAGHHQQQPGEDGEERPTLAILGLGLLPVGRRRSAPGGLLAVSLLLRIALRVLALLIARPAGTLLAVRLLLAIACCWPYACCWP